MEISFLSTVYKQIFCHVLIYEHIVRGLLVFIKLLANLLQIVIGNPFEQYDLQGGNEVQLCHRIVKLHRMRFKVNTNVCKSPM